MLDLSPYREVFINSVNILVVDNFVIKGKLYLLNSLNRFLITAWKSSNYLVRLIAELNKSLLYISLMDQAIGLKCLLEVINVVLYRLLVLQGSKDLIVDCTKDDWIDFAIFLVVLFELFVVLVGKCLIC